LHFLHFYCLVGDQLVHVTSLKSDLPADRNVYIISSSSSSSSTTTTTTTTTTIVAADANFFYETRTQFNEYTCIYSGILSDRPTANYLIAALC